MSTTSQESKITGAQETKDSDQKLEEIHSTLKREHDSTDDFECVEPENLLPEKEVLVKEEKKQQEGVKEQQEPRGKEDHRPILSMDTGVVHAEQVPPSAERFLLDDGFEGTDEREERAVPATPPPSADIEKYNSMLDPFQQQPSGKTASSVDTNDPRAATIAFVETERTAFTQAQNDAPASGAAPAAPIESTLLLDPSKSNDKEKIITSAKIDDEPRMNDDQISATILANPKDARDKESNVISSKDIDFDFFEATPNVPATKDKPETIDLLSTSNYETHGHGDEKLTKNERNLDMDDRLTLHEFVDIRPTGKQQSDANVDTVKDLLVAESMTKRKEQDVEKTMNSEVKPDSKTTSARTSTLAQDTGLKYSRYPVKSIDKIQEIEIAPKKIFTDMGLDSDGSEISCYIHRPQSRVLRIVLCTLKSWLGGFVVGRVGAYSSANCYDLSLHE